MKSFVNLVRRRIRDWPLFYRLLGSYLALALCLVVLINSTCYVVMRQMVIVENKTALTEKARFIAGIFREEGQGNPPYVRMKNIENLTDAQVIYVNNNLEAWHMPRLHSGHMPAQASTEALELSQIINALDVELVNSILAGDTACDVRKVEFMGGEVLFAGAPVYGTDATVAGAAILYLPFDQIRQVTATISWLIVLSSAAAALMATVLALIMSRRLANPIQFLICAAQRMSAGHYGEKVSMGRNDEFGQLGNVLEQLSFRLNEVIYALADEKSRLEQILSGIGEGIVAIDQRGILIHHNQAALELLNLPGWNTPAQPDRLYHRQQLLEMLYQAMRTGERTETVWDTASGRAIAAEVWPVLASENTAIGAVGLLRDVSEAQRLEQLRRDYVANISHELRTPLTGIRGMVEPLMDGYMETEAEKMDCYRVIYQETLRLEKMIGDMLDMSRLQAGRAQVDLEPLYVEGMLAAAQRRMKENAASGGIALTVEAPESLPEALGNEDRILQVLIILLDNALSFTPPGGEVVIFARAQGSRVYIGVRDTGAGIDPSDLPYIWERFYKADKSRMRTTGTGLGLSIAKLVVERMGGTISVQSELGKGTTFEFWLPVSA